MKRSLKCASTSSHIITPASLKKRLRRNEAFIEMCVDKLVYYAANS